MAGLIVKNTAGQVMLDMTSRISRTVGSFDTGTADGSVSVNFPDGVRWFIRVPNASTGLKGKPPAISLSGNTFSWAFAYRSGLNEYPVGATVHYGVR